jgi:hypothetical protein
VRFAAKTRAPVEDLPDLPGTSTGTTIGTTFTDIRAYDRMDDGQVSDMRDHRRVNKGSSRSLSHLQNKVAKVVTRKS